MTEPLHIRDCGFAYHCLSESPSYFEDEEGVSSERPTLNPKR